LIFFWWQGRMNPDESPATVEESSGMIEPSLSAPEEALTLAPEQTLPAFRDLSDASSQAVVEDRIDASADDLSSTDSSSVSPLSEPEPPFEAEPMTDTPATAVVSEEVSLSETSESAAAMAEPAPAPVAAGRVVFEFSGPCWVEVRDVNNRTRIIGVMREGTRRSLDAGLGPFRVVIGDIKVARLTVNGEAYDLQQHTRGKVARFTLDPSAL
jgi:cytoskeleton protein RodZ